MFLHNINEELYLFVLFIIGVFLKLYKSVHFKVLIFLILKDAETNDKLCIFTYKYKEFMQDKFCKFVKADVTLMLNDVILLFINVVILKLYSEH